jgi:hypothetical protein
MQLCCYGDSGEQLAVYSGPAVDVSFDAADFAKAGGQWIADYFGGTGCSWPETSPGGSRGG